MIQLATDMSCNYHECEVANGHGVCPAVARYIRQLEQLPGAERIVAPAVNQGGE